MKKFIIRKTWIVKAQTVEQAIFLIKFTPYNSIQFKILNEQKGGKQNDKEKIKIEKVKKSKGFKRW